LREKTGEVDRLLWFRSSYSGAQGGECVEIAVHGHIHVRDSKNTTYDTLAVDTAAWAAFLDFAAR
jgi:hypothetical protein